MKANYSFKEVDLDKITVLKKEWLCSLTSPQDGMWESFRNEAMTWGIELYNEMIGYAVIGEDNQLFQFYISPKYHSEGGIIFRQFIDKQKIKVGIVGTNNLTFLSIALNFVKSLSVHTYLFRENYDVKIEKKSGVLKQCQKEDIERLVIFCHYSLGASREWLAWYIGKLVDKGEIFLLDKDKEIIGTCEVRRSKTSPRFADIGMIVSPDFRRKGYGTYLLNKAKTIAYEWEKIPICSCEKENIGSLKSIRNCGFISKHQLLTITFK